MPNDRLLVAALCAQWCGVCRDWRAVFEQATQGLQAQVLWIDIEDRAELVGDELEFETLPSLLLARGDAVLYLGPVTPQAASLQRLLRAAEEGSLARVAEPAAQALLARVRLAFGD